MKGGKKFLMCRDKVAVKYGLHIAAGKAVDRAAIAVRQGDDMAVESGGLPPYRLWPFLAGPSLDGTPMARS
jgi:hypothetical protein